MAYLLGIDTGGTYTDAVVVDEALRVVATAKSLTTKHDLSIGVRKAMEAVLDQAPGDIGLVSLSTTLATNAIVEGHGSPIALILIGYPREALERAGLRQALDGSPVVFIDGGHNADGTEQALLDRQALRQAIERHAERVAAFAVSGYFAVRNPAHELTARELIRELCGHPVTLGHQLSASLDAPRRALTAALNAKLIPLLSQLIQAVQRKLEEKGILAPLMVVKGDGSLISAQVALECPVETILSGPAASVVGARFLSGEEDVFVSDMGGTTTDVAILRGGRPVLNKDGASVGGWRTMVEAVQVHTFGLGGDSEICLDSHGEFLIGPRRAMPLALLAEEYPRVLEVLRMQLEEPVFRPEDGCFALRLRPHDGAGMSYAQRKLWDILADGPVALRELLSDHTLERPLQRLIDRGLVILSRLTPSDCAHVLGRQHSWSLEAATLGAHLLARLAGLHGRRWDSVRAFCQTLVERVALLTGRCLVTSALAERSGQVLKELPPGQRELVDLALGGAAGDAELLGVRLSLRHPLVAIGAPVGIYYPEVAERLHTRLVIPEHAAIANALGAVAGGVMQKSVAHITPVGDEAFRVHIASGVKTFPQLEEAAAYATAETRRLAEEEASRAGATDIEVKTTRQDNVVKGPDGFTVFFESEIVATAYGRPRIVHAG
ncbi:MAG TPA: hydantoinase/oxoprolinase family protein [Candidatus Competibacteraceae bacterium]|nr:hydantoinase/oxoprolinase family protein [Candidatus Competibacteraceae bacterium]